MERSAALADSAPSGNPALRWLPFVILLATALILWLMWDRLPERWPIHYGLNGQPNNWATKTLTGVYLPIGAGLVLCGIFELLIAVNLAFPRLGRAKQLSPEAVQAITLLVAGFVRLLSLALALVFSALALMLPLVRPLSPALVVLVAIVCVFGAIGIGAWQMMKGARELKALGVLKDMDGWNGLVYNNPNDSRLWVPKITGVGYTLNFAKPGAKFAMGGIVAIPLVAMLVVFGMLLFK